MNRATAWGDLRSAFEHAATALPAEATDAQLDAYHAAWHDAMCGEAEAPESVQWKIEQFVKGADDGPYRDDLFTQYSDAIMADIQRPMMKFVATWLAAWTKDGGSVVIDDEGKAQIGWPVYDLSPNYREPVPTLPQEVRDLSFIYRSTAHDVTMKARFDALKMVPGGVAMLKAYMQAKGIRVAVHTTEAGQ